MVFDTYKMSAVRSRTDDMLIVMIDIRHLLGSSLNFILVPPYQYPHYILEILNS